MVGVYDGDVCLAAITNGKASTQKWMVDMDHVHGLKELFVLGLIAQGEKKACVRERQAWVSNDAWLVILVFKIAKGEDIYLVPG
jgi:hypothetical protein